MYKTVKKILHTGCLVFLFLTCSPTFGLGDPWTTVGTAGTVDEADLHDVLFVKGIARIKPTAADSSTVVLRYNVTSTADLNDDGVNVAMSVRFRDNGGNARVRLYLRGYNINNGSTITLLSLDSNDYAAASYYQQQTVQDDCAGVHFDFDNYAYYVEAHLSRTNTTGHPALSIIQIRDNDIC
jgi:hypothetical protein